MMSGKYWKTGTPVIRTTKVVSPTGGELLRQLGILIVGGAALIGFALVSIGSFGSAAAGEPIAPAAVAITSPTSVSPTSIPPTTAATAVPPTATATVAIATATAKVVATEVVASTPTAAATNTPTAQPPTAAPSPTPAAIAATPTTAPAVTGGAISYSRDVQPIFNQICVKCHGGEETKEGLSLKSYAEVMAGSDNGPVIAPGDAANSFLIQQVLNGKMPKKGPKLLPAQIRTLSDWVAAGAPNN